MRRSLKNKNEVEKFSFLIGRMWKFSSDWFHKGERGKATCESEGCGLGRRPFKFRKRMRAVDWEQWMNLKWDETIQHDFSYSMAAQVQTSQRAELSQGRFYQVNNVFESRANLTVCEERLQWWTVASKLCKEWEIIELQCQRWWLENRTVKAGCVTGRRLLVTIRAKVWSCR